MEETKTVDVLLVDDHDVVRNGIRALIERHEEFRVVAEAADGTAAIEYCRANQPDLALVDISMPGLDGVETIRDLMRRHPRLRILVLSMHADERSVVRSLKAGARGFVVKSANPQDLMEALRTVHRGGTWLSPAVSGHLMQRIQTGRFEDSLVRDTLPGLSNRETQVVRLIAEGLSTKEVAQRLSLSHETARSYRKTAMKKLGVSNASALTRLVWNSGILGEEPPKPE